VDRLIEIQAARPEDAAGLRYDSLEIVDVLEDVATASDVERGVRKRERLTCATQIFDLQPVRFSMHSCHGQRSCGGIHPGDATTETRELLCKEATTTPDIKNGLVSGIDGQVGEDLTEVLHPARVERGADRREGTVGAPPWVAGLIVDCVVGW